ncbi:flavin reductase family protein [Lentzea sp.]|uniref:flavin reductase family protein n=1 Tax=Lentzea sp. TaxID=56099 RepID=UPI002BFCCA40|nr:flavin reductase family protein [Lentzea sp.]HUQ57797.1 flavin reductase family protein [Lentzea sp.]
MTATAPEGLSVALHQHAKGVAVITAGLETPVGFCATSIAPVSLVPPVLSFAISTGSASWAVIETAEHVAVNLLADDQEDVARAFSWPGAEKFGPHTRWYRDSVGLPALHGVLSRWRIAPVERVRLGRHALVVGLVVDVELGAAGKRPLVHYDGGYGRLSRS